MKAYVLKSEQNRTTLELREKPTPQPSPTQLLVKIRAASMNRGELIRGQGLVKAGAEKPAGMDCAGEVVGTGEKVPSSAAATAPMASRRATALMLRNSWTVSRATSSGSSRRATTSW